MKKLAAKALVLVSLVLLALPAQAEEFADLIKRAQEFEAAGKFPQALTELGLASQQLQKRHVDKLKEFAPGDVEGLTAKPVKAEGAMGLISVQKQYRGDGGIRIKFALTGGSGGGAGGMGAMMGFANMAQAMGGGVNSESVRVKGKRGQLSNQNGRMKFSMSVGNGMMMMIEQQGNKATTKEQILAIANATDVEGLGKYLSEN